MKLYERCFYLALFCALVMISGAIYVSNLPFHNYALGSCIVGFLGACALIAEVRK